MKKHRIVEYIWKLMISTLWAWIVAWQLALLWSSHAVRNKIATHDAVLTPLTSRDHGITTPHVIRKRSSSWPSLMHRDRGSHGGLTSCFLRVWWSMAISSSALVCETMTPFVFYMAYTPYVWRSSDAPWRLYQVFFAITKRSLRVPEMTLFTWTFNYKMRRISDPL